MATITAPRSAPPKANLNGAPDPEFGEVQRVTSTSWGNAGPLALLSFAVVTFMLSMVNAKLVSAGVTPVILAVGLVFGGSTQLVAGLIQLRSGDVFQGVLFSSFGAFWILLAAFLTWFLKTVPLAQQGHSLGLLLYSFAILATVLWAASLRTSRVVVVALGFVVATFWLLAAGNYGAHTSLIHAGGYTGIVAAALATYLALAELCVYAYGRSVFPVGSLAKV